MFSKCLCRIKICQKESKFWCFLFAKSLENGCWLLTLTIQTFRCKPNAEVCIKKSSVQKSEHNRKSHFPWKSTSLGLLSFSPPAWRTRRACVNSCLSSLPKCFFLFQQTDVFSWVKTFIHTITYCWLNSVSFSGIKVSLNSLQWKRTKNDMNVHHNDWRNCFRMHV